ncbi:isopentenyl-diphosphate delta-isomerase [Pedococcus dokdonensis]|uniref:Isopentenyl-diphosphate Delta-isomerase n=1 Tax=Pedococcus dokdonensis TaxID=443156 RepID=A0A1H0UB47_9MICO|nr:isopentenyl-diphosphate Delta-isomerase [Pedococcus dokdonensis]SDP63225.1 isopentenyl-diphosphate delta-isomerase [Pedococcus dokdonensis]
MTELVVLLDDQGRAVGTQDKATVHHGATPLHLAFSAYLVDPEGALLVTQRAPSKATFPGVWTNSVCGHPAPGEPLDAAVRRRARDELGVTIGALRLVLPAFAYVAEQGGVVENERCPVFMTELTSRELTLDPAEVGGTEWVPWADFSAEVLDGRRTVSSWCREQVEQLVLLGPQPRDWPAADPTLLPRAARLAGLARTGDW